MRKGILALAATITAILLLSYAALALYSQNYHMTAPVSYEYVRLYFDSECTTPVPTSYDWTQFINAGTTLTVYVKNAGTEEATINVTLTSNQNCSITITPDTFTLAPGASTSVDITFSQVSPPTVSWDFRVDAQKTP